MGIKQNIGDLLRVGEIKDSIVEIVEAKVELKKIEIQERAEKTLTTLAYNLFLGLLMLMSFIFLLILLGFLINMSLGAPWGFIIILSVCIFCLVLAKVYKKPISEKIRKEISKEIDTY